MINIAKLLNRISSSINKDSFIKETVIDVIRLHTHVSVAENKISIKDGVLEIEVSSTARSEINMHQQVILDTLNKQHKIFVSRILYK